MKHWTDSTDLEAAEFFDSLSEREIRRRQDLCSQQMQMAYKEWSEHGRDMTDALHDLEKMEAALTASMLRRL